MTRAAGFAIPIAVFVLGAALGGYFGFRIAQPRVFADEMARISHYSAYVDIQRANATDAAYEEALRGFLGLLNTARGNSSSGIPDRAYAFDAAVTYVRLSQLAAKRGAKEEATAFLGKASALCPRIGWKACSETILVDATERLDTQTLFGRKSAP
jgi:hypothetical protein